MSDHGHEAHGHDHGHDGAGHGTMRDYVIGFVLSVILTAIPFWLVMGKTFGSSSTTAMVILGFAAVQIVVHMVYFLHMNTRVEGGWSFMAMALTIVLVVITLSGSMWVMYHLNTNMMPHADMEMSTPHDMGAMNGMEAMHNMSEMP